MRNRWKAVLAVVAAVILAALAYSSANATNPPIDECPEVSSFFGTGTPTECETPPPSDDDGHSDDDGKDDDGHDDDGDHDDDDDDDGDDDDEDDESDSDPEPEVVTPEPDLPATGA